MTEQKNPKGVWSYVKSFLGSSKSEQVASFGLSSGQLEFNKHQQFLIPQENQVEPYVKSTGLAEFKYTLAVQIPKSEFKQAKNAWEADEEAGLPYSLEVIPEILGSKGFKLIQGSEKILLDEAKQHPILGRFMGESVVSDAVLAAYERTGKKDAKLLKAPTKVTTGKTLVLVSRELQEKDVEDSNVINFVGVLREEEEYEGFLPIPGQEKQAA